MVEEKNNPNEPKNSGVALLDKEEVKEENKEKNSTIEEDIEIKEDTDTGKGVKLLEKPFDLKGLNAEWYYYFYSINCNCTSWYIFYNFCDYKF